MDKGAGESDGSCNAQGGLAPGTTPPILSPDGRRMPRVRRSSIRCGAWWILRRARGFRSRLWIWPNVQTQPCCPVIAGSDLKAIVCRSNGRPEWIRTIDLFRVKEAL